MKEQKYRNLDERFGSEMYEFTIPEMVAQYRELGWDEYEDDDGFTQKMSDEEIIEDIFDHDIEEI